MNHNDILTELNLLIHKLDSIIDIMLQSTKEIIDTGNVNYQLKKIIDKLDVIIDSLDDSNEKSMLETAKYDVTFATTDLIDDTDIFEKISKLRDAKNALVVIRSKLDIKGHL